MTGFLDSSDAVAQRSWIGGVGWRSAPRMVRHAGRIGLQALPDREWSFGAVYPARRISPRVGFGGMATIRFRSPFYELDQPLPYYPLKTHVPTLRLESAQLFSFVSLRGEFFGSKRVGWRLLGGPVLNFHAGNYKSTTTAMTNPGGVPFVLYRLSTYAHPWWIPYWRTQFSGSIRLWKRSAVAGYIDPFVSVDLGDRSSYRYQVLPDDVMNIGEGNFKNGKWLFGFHGRFSFGR